MTANRTAAQAPSLIRRSNSLSTWLLRHGMPMGPNGLLTVRGRSSGEPRTAPVAIAAIEGRRYVIGAYGDVQWTRNLRAAGEADIRLHGRDEHVRAVELDHAAALEFFGVTLRRYVGRFPLVGRAFARVLFGLVGPEVLDDPMKAAATRPVFELFTAEPSGVAVDQGQASVAR